MEEFKNLKEIIELCREELIFVDENVNATLDGEDLRELRNLINKCKVQEKHIKALDLVIVEHIEKNKEQEELIDFMIDWIRERSIYCVDSREQLKEYFKKKAKGE